MYRKTQQPPAEPLTRRDKRGIAIVGALVLAVSAGLGIWAAVRPGGYCQSRDGCGTLTVPSSTRGGLLPQSPAGRQGNCPTAVRPPAQPPPPHPPQRLPP